MRALIVCLSLACLAGAAPAWANGGAAQPTAVSSPQFRADAALAEHMSHVGAAVDALQHYEHGHMDQAQGAALATIIEDHVQQIIATCKLPPDQDARLHTIIVPLLDNADALKSNPARVELVQPLRKAMQDYRTVFGVAAQN